MTEFTPEEHFYRARVDQDRIPEVVRTKWGAELLEEGFVPLPKKLLRCVNQVFKPEHALVDFIVILGIADFITVKKRRRPMSYRYLAFITGLQEDVVVESLLRSQDAGYVELDADPETEYRFHPRITGLGAKVSKLTDQTKPWRGPSTRDKPDD